MSGDAIDGGMAESLQVLPLNARYAAFAGTGHSRDLHGTQSLPSADMRCPDFRPARNADLSRQHALRR